MKSTFQFLCYGTRTEKETSPWQFFELSPREGFDLQLNCQSEARLTSFCKVSVTFNIRFLINIYQLC